MTSFSFLKYKHILCILFAVSMKEMCIFKMKIGKMGLHKRDNLQICIYIFISKYMYMYL